MSKSDSHCTQKEVITLLNTLLTPEQYSDSSWNGMQVQSENHQVQLIGLAVDAGLSVIQEAIAQNCDLLVTHHGLFWGNCSPTITGITGTKVRALLKGDCSLYVSHLPLDGHPVVGNAAELARVLKLKDISRAFLYEGACIGVIGTLPNPISQKDFPEFVYTRVIPSEERGITCTLPFGKNEISRIGIATGSASACIPEAKRLGCDAFISGEPKHEAYHLAKEEMMNVVFAGHYCTETFGVRAIGKYLEKELQLSTVFIDEPSGI